MKHLPGKLWLICLCACFILSDVSRHLAQDDTSLTLWVLASDEAYMNAHLLNYDLTTKTQIDEVILPHYMKIASAAWSPDFETLAVVTMFGTFPDHIYNGICFFNRAGALYFCRTMDIIEIGASVMGGGGGPAPVYWSADSQTVYVVVNQTDPYPRITVLRQVAVLSIHLPSQEVTSLYTVNYDEPIQQWLWSPDGQYAVDCCRGRLAGDSKFMVVRLEPDIHYILSEFEANERAVSQAGLILATNDEDKNVLKVAQVGETGLNILQAVPLPAYQSIDVNAINSLAMANNSVDAAFTIPLYPYEGGGNCGSVFPCNRLFRFNLETSWITQLASEFLFARQLSWSPDARYLAASLCQAEYAYRCQMNVFDEKKLYMEVDTGFPENRDPQWQVNR